MSLHIPAKTYETLFRNSDQIPGVFSWSTYGSCKYGQGCDYCDILHQNRCSERILRLLVKHDLSPTQAFLCTNNKLTIVQLEDYPEYFV